MRDAPLQSCQFALQQVHRAFGHDASRERDKQLLLVRLFRGACDVMKSAD
jgi:hypothetical protein